MLRINHKIRTRKGTTICQRTYNLQQKLAHSVTSTGNEYWYIRDSNGKLIEKVSKRKIK